MILILERDVFGYEDQLAEAALQLGFEVVWWDSTRPVPTKGDVFLGSLNACSEHAMPGVVGDHKKLAVKQWLPLVRDIALNPEVIEATVGNLPEIPWDGAFVRPDSCLKPFSGRVVGKFALNPESLDYGYYFQDLDLPVALSEVKGIVAEWRFVVVDRKVVAYSGYTPYHEPKKGPFPLEAGDLAIKAALLCPEPSVVIDICRLQSGEYKLVEFNLLSGSDFYGCNLGDILLALRDRTS